MRGVGSGRRHREQASRAESTHTVSLRIATCNAAMTNLVLRNLRIHVVLEQITVSLLESRG